MTKRSPVRYVTLAATLFFTCAIKGVLAHTLQVGPGMTYRHLADIATAVHDGDRITIAPGTYFECLVLRTDNLTIEGNAPNAGVVITGPACMGKGLLVTIGNNITVRNVTLVGARVEDLNGAGIRNEGNNLTVDRVRFIGNQNGILSTGAASSRILVRDSYFERNGSCADDCAHGIYVGHAGLLRVERSVFTGTVQGHHIKSRALRTEILDCSITDGDNGSASYLIDIPNGGDVVVRDNRLQKGPQAESHIAAMRIGEEGLSNTTSHIEVNRNEFRNGGNYHTTFVWNDTPINAELRQNRLVGDVQPLHGSGRVR